MKTKTDMEILMEDVDRDTLRQIKELTDEVLDDYNNGKFTKEELELFLTKRNEAVATLKLN